MDMNKGVSFEAYANSGTAEEKELLFRQIERVKPSERFLEAASRVKIPVRLLVFVFLECPDGMAVVPFVHFLSRVNENIEVLFFPRDEDTTGFMVEKTGVSRVPTLMFVGEDGEVISDVFVERPLKVKEMLEARISEEDKQRVISDFRHGKYDGFIEEDIIGMLRELGVKG